MVISLHRNIVTKLRHRVILRTCVAQLNARYVERKAESQSSQCHRRIARHGPRLHPSVLMWDDLK